LVPLVRIEAHARRRAFLGGGGVAGEACYSVHLRPIAILEKGPAGERRIPIRPWTKHSLGGLILAALVIPLLMATAVRLARGR
jgi:hypothetical protein